MRLIFVMCIWNIMALDNSVHSYQWMSAIESSAIYPGQNVLLREPATYKIISLSMLPDGTKPLPEDGDLSSVRSCGIHPWAILR